MYKVEVTWSENWAPGRDRASLLLIPIQVPWDPFFLGTRKDLRAHQSSLINPTGEEAETLGGKVCPRSKGCNTVKATIWTHSFMTVPFPPHHISSCSEILWWLFLEVFLLSNHQYIALLTTYIFIYILILYNPIIYSIDNNIYTALFIFYVY